MNELQEIIDLAITDFKDELGTDRDDWPSEPHDLIYDIADSCTPVYTQQLMRLAADNMRLATDEPEFGPAFDGSPTPVNIVAANVYEAIAAALWEEWNFIQMGGTE